MESGHLTFNYVRLLKFLQNFSNWSRASFLISLVNTLSFTAVIAGVIWENSQNVSKVIYLEEYLKADMSNILDLDKCPNLVVCPISSEGLRDPRLLGEVGDLTTTNHSELMR